MSSSLSFGLPRQMAPSLFTITSRSVAAISGRSFSRQNCRPHSSTPTPHALNLRNSSTRHPSLLIKLRSTSQSHYPQPQFTAVRRHYSQQQGSNRVSNPVATAANHRHKLKTRDRGPKSEEDTQTDFAELNVLGSIAVPTTSVDTCLFDGFQLDSGLRVGEGDGVVLVGGEGFVWRPWMAGEEIRGIVGAGKSEGVVNGRMIKGSSEMERTGGVLNKLGQFEVTEQAWGVFSMLWPRPDLLIIGTGPTIRPLAPPTRKYLQTLGVRLEVLDTRNAASQFNMLVVERGVNEVAAALVPIGFGLK